MPALELRRPRDRFVTQTSWLTSRHSFSYGDHYDPANVALGPLMVHNHDLLSAGAGFGEHEHSGVDIVTVVLAGRLRHDDSAGHREVLGPGDVQVLRTGAGTAHSETNDSADEPVDYIQMWLRSHSSHVSYDRPKGGVLLPGGAMAMLRLETGERWGQQIPQLGHLYVASGVLTVPHTALTADQGSSLRAASTRLNVTALADTVAIMWVLAG